MSKPNKKRYRLSQIIQEVRDEKPSIEIETDDSQVFEIPPMELWNDQVLELSAKEPVEAFRTLMGEDRYDAFVAQGGSTALANFIISKATGADRGESSASSGS